MTFEQSILAVITTKKEKVSGSGPIFLCDTVEELNAISSNLEYILDGVTHQISDELFIIVRH